MAWWRRNSRSSLQRRWSVLWAMWFVGRHFNRLYTLMTILNLCFILAHLYQFSLVFFFLLGTGSKRERIAACNFQDETRMKRNWREGFQCLHFMFVPHGSPTHSLRDQISWTAPPRWSTAASVLAIAALEQKRQTIQTEARTVRTDSWN